MLTSLNLSAEEFTARRRKAQESLEQALTPVVKDALTTDSYGALMDKFEELFQREFKEESGFDYSGSLASWKSTVEKVLRKTQGSDLHSVNAAALWLATLILTQASIQAAITDRSGEVFLEWVDMHDNAVRATHREANGQVRPAGEKFKVGGYEMIGPGDVTAPVDEWINCRCTLRPTLASAMTASGGHMDGQIPWHGVLAPEGVWTGDKRKFTVGSISWRPLPLPLTWQKVSDEGHKGNITVAMIEGTFTDPDTNEVWGWGNVLQTVPEHDEWVGLLAEAGRFGVSIDADEIEAEFDEEVGGNIFTAARGSSACTVSIPAFAQAWVALGPLPDKIKKKVDQVDPADPQSPVDIGTPPPDAQVPEDQMIRPDAPPPPDMTDPVDPKKKKRDPLLQKEEEDHARRGMQSTDRLEEFVNTEDGPGWLTNPEDTDRLRDYWVHGEGAAKIGWGTPGDFNRCRLNVGKYVLPQHLNGYCANRHFDALGFWPGRPVAGDTEGFNIPDGTDTTPALRLVASVTPPDVSDYPAAWFEMAEPDISDPRVVEGPDGPGVPFTVTKEGQVYGHVALWGSCHIDFPGLCTNPPRSMSAYREFHVHAAHLDDGTVRPVGVVSVGGGHANMRLGMKAAKEHYDDVRTGAAHVAASDGAMGIWVCGSITPWATADQLAMLRSIPVSGDWRDDRFGNAEMIAAHAINVPGFSIPRAKIAAANGHITALVASAGLTPEVEEQAPDPTMSAALEARMRELDTEVTSLVPSE